MSKGYPIVKTASQIQRTPFLTLALTLLGVLMLSITRAHLHAQDITYQAYVDGVFRRRNLSSKDQLSVISGQ